MYRATRGVCIGVERHLAAGDPVPPDLTAAEVKYLQSIGAVLQEADPTPAPAANAAPETPVPANSGKKES